MLDLTLEELTSILVALPLESADPDLGTARDKIKREITVRLKFFGEGANK